MIFRKAVKADIDNIMSIIKQAQAYFKVQGIDQWQNNYPNDETISKDIANEYGYVLVIDGKIVGTTAVSFDGEKTYDRIYNGQWLSDRSYAVIHRMAVDEDFKGQGLSSLMVKKIEALSLENKIHSIKVDTHEKNLPMQRTLQKNGFQYCGIIYLEDKSKRIAFEKLIQA